MDDKQIQKAFSNLQLNKDIKEEIWKNLENSGKKTKSFSLNWMKPAVVVAISVIVIAVGINAATGGRAWAAVKEALGISKNTQEVVSQVATYPNGVYAPDILFINEKYLAFGTMRGLILIERKNNELMGVIDLQKIGCFYFETDNKKTHVLNQNNKIIIFNSENNKATGSYFIYSIEDASLDEWKMEEEGKDTKNLEDYFKAWNVEQKNYLDTFDIFLEQKIDLDEFIEQEAKMGRKICYSERSVSWSDVNEKEYISYLTVDSEGQYVLNIFTVDDKTTREEILKISAGHKSSIQTVFLPEFEYVGDDKVIESINSYLKENKNNPISRNYDMHYREGHQVWIPAYVIYASMEKDGYLYVFGDFAGDFYKQNGNILESIGGGSTTARVQLKKTKDGYKVVEALVPRDGGLFFEDLKNFADGFPGVYEKITELYGDDKLYEQCRLEYMKMYVEKNHLDIKYYKDFGWDPVEIK